MDNDFNTVDYTQSWFTTSNQSESNSSVEVIPKENDVDDYERLKTDQTHPEADIIESTEAELQAEIEHLREVLISQSRSRKKSLDSILSHYEDILAKVKHIDSEMNDHSEANNTKFGELKAQVKTMENEFLTKSQNTFDGLLKNFPSFGDIEKQM